MRYPERRRLGQKASAVDPDEGDADVIGQSSERLEEGRDLVVAAVQPAGVDEPEARRRGDRVAVLAGVEAVGEHRHSRSQRWVAATQIVGDLFVDGGHAGGMGERPALEGEVRPAVGRRGVDAKLACRPGVAVVGEPGQARQRGDAGRGELGAASRRARKDRVEVLVADQPQAADYGERAPGDVRVGHEQPAVGQLAAGGPLVGAGSRGQRRSAGAAVACVAVTPPAGPGGGRPARGAVQRLGTGRHGAHDPQAGGRGDGSAGAAGKHGRFPTELGQVAQEA